MCCSGGKVKLPALPEPPSPLKELLDGSHPKSKSFLGRIRRYNAAFQMTSFGAKEEREAGFMPTFKVTGQVYHLIGSLLPEPQEQPQFLQIYFMGDEEEQCDRRLQVTNREEQSVGRAAPPLDRDVILSLQEMLHETNALVRGFRTAMEAPDKPEEFKVVINADKRPAGEHERRYNAPVVNEVAVLMVGDPTKPRDIVIHSRDQRLQRIKDTHRSYDALQYPLIFFMGQDGYAVDIPQVDPRTSDQVGNKTVSCMDFYAYSLMVREGQSNYLLLYRELFNQFLVDMYAKVESERLRYIRNNQTKLRAEQYIHLRDAVVTDGNVQDMGQLVILPSSHTGSPRYMHERTQDAMTYVRNYGTADLFITFTCNPNWKKIQDLLLPGQQAIHRYDIVARVFRRKAVALVNLVTKHQLFGEHRCYMYTVEWQKRGLPHVHLLLWLKEKIRPNEIDSIISAELPDPDEDPALFETIKKQMLHGPCGAFNTSSPCMRDGQCSKRYPKQMRAETQTGEDGYPEYRRRKPEDGGFKTVINQGRNQGMEIDNRWVVPYSPILCKIFDAHINVESCNSIKSIKYVCKYVNKGSDAAVMALQNRNDEVAAFQEARYISSNEAAWHLLGFPIHERFPTIVRLAVHLEDGQRVYFDPTNPQSVQNQTENPKDTTLTAFFKLCQDDEFAATLLYPDVPKFFTWQESSKKWQRRAQGEPVDGHPEVRKGPALGRVYTVHPNNFECYFLRMLLHRVPGPTSFADVKSVEGQVCETYRQACQQRGLLEDDGHWSLTLTEAAVSSSPHQLRSLFAVMLMTCGMSNPAELWEAHKEALSEDIVHRLQRQNPDADVSAAAYNEALILLEDKVLQLGGADGLRVFNLPTPERDQHNLAQEIVRETSYDIPELQSYVEDNEPRLNPDQRSVFNSIEQALGNTDGAIFFIDAPGGTGKTFVLNLLLAKVRQERKIALAVASSGIAATLLKGGRTAHSTFKLPLDLVTNENPVCNVSKTSALAKVLQKARLIVWDECTMSHRRAFEALDKTLRDLRGAEDKLMGGVTVVLGGDFRQTLPVVPKGTRADEIRACLKSSSLWWHVQKLQLSLNMRVHLFGDQSAGQFSAHLMSIGNGQIPLDQEQKLHKLPCGQMVASVNELQNKVFPGIAQNFGDHDWLRERAILAPRNDAVDKINLSLLQTIPGTASSFRSIDTVIDQDQALQFPAEFLNSLMPSGFPPHNLILKVGVPIMLLRNLDPPRLCNGTRLVVKSLRPHVLEATILTGNYKGEDVFIPRIPLPNSADQAIQFKRLQFPVRLSFAMSINKSQGQSLKVVGLNLQGPCFSHGQLYVGCSRVGNPKGLYIYSPKKGLTENIVYHEALQN